MSTSSYTSAIFRDGVSSANRQNFVTNLAKFVAEWVLDGVDIDWEDPGEQLPPDSANDGEFLAAVLTLLESLLNLTSSLSASRYRHRTGT